MDEKPDDVARVHQLGNNFQSGDPTSEPPSKPDVPAEIAKWIIVGFILAVAVLLLIGLAKLVRVL